MLPVETLPLREQPRLLLQGPPTSELYFHCKRVLDLFLATLALIALAPLLLLLVLLIKLDSPGPVLFVQERVGARRRVGEGGNVWEVRTFRLYKLRSMHHGSDEQLHRAHIQAFVEGRLAGSGEPRAPFKLVADPRVTRVGRLLRRTSLDELPQLLNVLKGEMSLVGPRPVPLYEAAAYQDWHLERLTALPGITGLWQVRGRARVAFDEMVRLDIEYVRRRSLWLDLQILLLTVPAVLSGEGAA